MLLGRAMFALAIFFAWLVLTLLGLAFTAWLVRRSWKRGKLASTATRLVAALVGGAALAGSIGSLIGIVMAFGAVGGESIDPAQKARILAEGIAQVMNCVALGLLVWLPSVVALLVMTRARKSSADRS